jgi:hypothetical protein
VVRGPGFLEDREDWLKVEILERPGGSWDVVLVIDGTYGPSAEGFLGDDLKKATVKFFSDWIAEELAR